MPFKAMLKELISSVEGATGAIVLEADGEAVQWQAAGDGEQLRLRAAYIAVAIRLARASADCLKLGNAGCAVFEYDGASFIIEELEHGYFLALELEAWANISEAIHQIQPAVQDLRRLVAA